jgi:hypothetical protein
MTGRQYDPSAGEAASIGKRQFESPRSRGELYHFRTVNFTDRLLPKPVGVLQKELEAQRAADSLVGFSVDLAEAFQRETTSGVPEIRGEALRFENHAFGHERAPTLKGSAEDLKGLLRGSKVRRNRQTIRPGANDYNVRVQLTPPVCLSEQPAAIALA